MNEKRLTVYCSGPLFSPEERAGMLAIANTFEAEGMAIRARAKTIAEWEELRRMDSFTLPQIYSAVSRFGKGLRARWLFQMR